MEKRYRTRAVYGLLRCLFYRKDYQCHVIDKP